MFIVLLLYVYRPFLVCYFYPGGLVFVSKLVPLPDICTNQPLIPATLQVVMDYIMYLAVASAEHRAHITNMTYVVQCGKYQSLKTDIDW